MVYLHLHKSGGTFVNALLLRCVASARRIGYHFPYRELPAEYRDRPVVGTVRNPWAYYVSWYHFQLTRPKPTLLFQICSAGGALGFERTVANLTDLANDNARLALLERGLPETYAVSGLNLTKDSVSELRERRVGFYSFLYERMYAGAGAAHIVRAEQLRDELRRVLSEVGHLPNACAERFLDGSPPLNVTSHEAPSTYYSAELAALVADRDSKIIARHGYALDG